MNLLGGSWWYIYPLKNMSSSIGMMKFPIHGNKHVPNHQAVQIVYMSLATRVGKR